jgi:glutamate-1-semialdehyde 2,1-aminomutase
MERIKGWQRLEELGSQLEESMRSFIKGKPLTFQRIGSMFCLYFCEAPVRNLAEAKKSDTAAFARYFHAALQNGIYFAPSQFEAGFLSTAHAPEMLERSAKIISRILNPRNSSGEF